VASGWGIHLHAFDGLKPPRITGKPAGNTDLSVTVVGKPVRRRFGEKRPNLAVAVLGEGGVGAEWPFGGEGKTLGLPPYKELTVFIFPSVLPSLNFVGCVTLNFLFLFSPKILKSALVFFRIFISNFHIHRLVYQKPEKMVRTGFTGFRLVFQTMAVAPTCVS
jgi:hypothetical protein